MANLMVYSIGCPNCGAPYTGRGRKCGYCQAILIATSLGEAFASKMIPSQNESGINHWRETLKKDPESAEANFAIGLSYLHSKLRDAALIHLRKASLNAPEIADVHYNLAVALFADGDCSQSERMDANRAIDCCLRLAPDFQEALGYRRFITARHLESTNIGRAIDEYIKAIDACPDIDLFHNQLGQCYMIKAELEKAAACFHSAITLNPSCVAAHIHTTELLFRKEQFIAGIEMGRRAVALAAEMPATLQLERERARAHNQLALCLWKGKNKQEALEQIEKAIEHDPNNASYKKHRAAIKNDCFIVTATVGTSFHPWIYELTAFRDLFLVDFAVGRYFIRCYEHLSPWFAQRIAKSKILRQFTCIFLVAPAICMTRMLTCGRYRATASTTGTSSKVIDSQYQSKGF